MYAWYIFRSLYTFNILFLFFELWCPKGNLIVKSSQWGGWACAHTHTYEHTCPAPQRETSISAAPTESTGGPMQFLLSRWLGSKTTSAKYVSVWIYLCVYIYILIYMYIYKNTVWIIPVVGPRFPGLPRCWHPDIPDVDVHNPAPVAGTPTSYPPHSHISTEKIRAL